MSSTKQIILNDKLGIAYDDGTYRCHHWSLDDYSFWKLGEDGCLWYSHHGDDWRKCAPTDELSVARWAEKITTYLLEREIFSDR